MGVSTEVDLTREDLLVRLAKVYMMYPMIIPQIIPTIAARGMEVAG